MRYIQIHSGEQIPVIGMGTWTFGGSTIAEHSQDTKHADVLRIALELGYTHFDTAEMYADGNSETLLGSAIQNFDRSKLFITTKVKPPHLTYPGVLRSLDASLNRLGIDFIDLYLIHWPDRHTPLSSTFKALNEAVRAGKVHHLGVSNFDLDLLKEAISLSETPIITNQVPYSLFNRDYVRNGVLQFCQEHKIILTAYSPVEEGSLRQDPVLQAIANTVHASPFQVALAWLVQQPNVIAIPMSHNPLHLAENLAAADISLSTDAILKLDALGR